MKLIKGSVFVFALLFGMLASCDTDDNNDAATQTVNSISDIVQSDSRFTTLATALSEANLVETLDSEGSFTVFAPTDDAFDALPEGTLDALLADTEKLTNVLQQHVLTSSLSSAQVLESETVTTLFGQTLDIDSENVSIGGVLISATDIAASNGVIHVIDAVLVPRDLVAEAEYRGFTTLKAALEAAELNDDLADPNGPFTVFAPTNEAFAALGGALDTLLQPENQNDLIDVLQNHVVSGEYEAEQVVSLSEVETLNGAMPTITVSGAEVSINSTSTVTATDIKALNGVIHVIDTVIATVP